MRRVTIPARRASLAIAVAVLAWPSIVPAETALEDSVAKRARPSFDAIGIVVGPYDSFLLHPEFALEFEATDNLFSEDNDKLADVATVFKPSFDVASDWDNHALGLSGDLEFSKYHDNVEENSLDLNIGAIGRLDVLEKSNLNGSLNVARKHQDRGDPDDDVAGVVEAELTIFRTASLTFGGEYNADAILLRLNANVNRTDFDDAGATNNDDRDRVEFETRGRVGYEWVPGSTAFVEAALDIREFDKAVDDNGFKRSSQGYEILLGNTLDLTGVTFAELGLGYIRQDFGDQPAGTPNLGPTQGFSFKSDLVWNPTDLLSVTSTMRRTVNETTVLGAASAFTSSFGLRVDYGILENLILDAGADLDIESFDGIDREDKNLEMKLGAEYLIGANFIAAAKYSYEERFSDEPGGSFVTNTFMISLAARL